MGTRALKHVADPVTAWRVQSTAEHRAQRERRQDGERRIPGLPTAGRARLGRPGCDRLVGEPNRPAATLAQAGVVGLPVGRLALLAWEVVAVILVQLERQVGHPEFARAIPYVAPLLNNTTRSMHHAALRHSRPCPTGTWHLDEMVVRISGRRRFLWRAVDSEGEVLDILVQRRHNKAAALRLLRKLLRRHGVKPEAIVTNALASYRSAANAMGMEHRHRPGRLRGNNRAENSHQPIRRQDRVMKRFKSQASAQQFFATHAAVYNAFNIQRLLLCAHLPCRA